MSKISDINLDKIVSELRRIARSSTNEEEFKINVTNVINENIISVLDLKMGRFEYSLVSGARADALYGHVLIEYKAPGILSTASGFSRAKEQIINYIMSEAGTKERFRYFFGIIIGDMIGFVKYNTITEDWVVRGPYEINKEVVLKIVEALRGLRRKKLCAEELLRDFGPESEVASAVIGMLYDKLESTKSPKTALLFEDWVRIFSQITGYKEEDLQGLDAFYDTKGKDYSKLLFCIHTYYALLMKIIAAELAYLYGAGRYLKSYVAELEDKYMEGIEEFKDSIKDLEEGGLFKKLLKIRNFIEGGYFSWYLEEFDKDLMDVIAEIARQLSDYEPATPVLEPEETKDMLKIIYQKLVPRPIRHNLGEYYTPDWLAQFLLDRVGFTIESFEEFASGSQDITKPLELRLLDPACGSGTFLVEALKRLRAYAEEHYITDMMSEYVVGNIIGIDLNPLAVLAARTNYLLNIGDLLSYTSDVEIPIYLADSITIRKMAAVYGTTYRVKTAAGEFRIPCSIVDKSGILRRILPIIEECVELGYTPEEFDRKIRDTYLDLSDSEIEGIKNGMYILLSNLEREGKDRIWLTILLNAFAPLFIGKFDYVVGNPPWVLWDNLPKDYRDDTQDIWKDYNLFTLTASQARHGGGKKDISILFTYVCIDRYLKDSGTFGFLITQSVFKTKGAGEGFRQFQLKDTGLDVVEAHDFVDVQPFEGTSNRTAAIIMKKGRKTEYPVKYTVWRKLFDIDLKESFETASKKLHSIEMAAIFSDPDNELSPWITVPSKVVPIVQRAYGKSSYSVYEGTNSGGANGVYWLRIIDVVNQYVKTIDLSKPLRETLGIENEMWIRELLVENVTKGMKKEVRKVKTVIEDFFVYPLLKSKNVRKWKIDGYGYTLLMQNPLKRIGFDEGWVKMGFSKTYSYLKGYEKVLLKRAAYKKFMKSRSAPFYSMYNVGEYTFAPYKVIWNRMGSRITACVISVLDDKYLGKKLVLPDNVLAFIPTSTEDEAHYICSIMNSSITDMILRSIGGGTKSFGTPKIVEDTIRIPKYDKNNELHNKLSSLSRKAHEIAQRGGDTLEVEEEIDNVVTEIYGISDESLQTVKETLLIQEGELPEEESEVVEEEKPEVHFLNTVVEPKRENQIEVTIMNPSRDSVRLIIDVFGEQVKLKTFNSEENLKIRIGPLEEGQYDLPYTLITPKDEMKGVVVLQVKSVPKHRKGSLSKAVGEFFGEENE